MEKKFDGLPIKEICAIAVREKNEEILHQAVQHLSKRTEYFDPNDIISDLTIIHHTASKLNLNADSFLENKARDACKELKQEIISFINRSPEDKKIEAMGYKEVNEPVFHYEFAFLKRRR